MIEYPRMADVIPEGVSGDVKIEHFVVDEQAAAFTRIRAAVNPGRDEYVPEGKYAKLSVGGQTMMTDTLMEKSSNRDVVLISSGHVLIAGLGLGMILHPIAAKDRVLSVTVVEKSPDVVKLVGPYVPKKVTVVNADIFEWTPPKGAKYDTIYFDIWPNITLDNLPGMTKLHRRFGRFKAEGGWMESWKRDHLLRLRRREARDPWRGMVKCGYGR